MIIEINSETLPYFTRYNGGWLKTITKIDKDYQNGYSLVGKFLPLSSGKINLHENELYLDCSIGGSRKHQEKSYHLFKIVGREIVIIQTIECAGRDWAVSLWDSIEEELNLVDESKVKQITENIQNLNDSQFLELMDWLSKFDSRYKQFVELLLLDMTDSRGENVLL